MRAQHRKEFGLQKRSFQSVICSVARSLLQRCGSAAGLRKLELRFPWALLGSLLVCLQLDLQPAFAQLGTEPTSQHDAPIIIHAKEANHWSEGTFEVWLLRDSCFVQQGTTEVHGKEAVVWVERGEPGLRPHRMTLYFEGEVHTRQSQASETAGPHQQWFGTLESNRYPDFRVGKISGEPDPKPSIYRKATNRRDPARQASVQRTQFAEFGSSASSAVPIFDTSLQGFRRIYIGGLGSVIRPTLTTQVDPVANKTMATITGGVNIIIDSPEGLLDISADNVVMWYAGTDLSVGGSNLQASELPLEIYMERNIVFMQGARVIEADSMYYDVRQQIGSILSAELTSPIDGFDGQVKLRAGAIQQLGPSRFSAQNTSLTTSRMGLPTYDIRSQSLLFEDNQSPTIDPVTGQPNLDPLTGKPILMGEQRVTARGNGVFVSDIPIFWWPTLSTNLQQPNTYIERIRFRTDQVLGTQILTDFNAHQLFGIASPPEGTDWTLSLDYLSKRGPAFGSTYSYDQHVIGDAPGRKFGSIDGWFIYDTGVDRLGRDRMEVEFEDNFRGRVRAEHSQSLPNGWTLKGELGYTTDRNFMEQYYEREWDERKDLRSGLMIENKHDNWSWTVDANGNLNPFFLDTQWLPKTDLFTIGQPILNDTLTWFQHTNLGYARQDMANAPYDPSDAAKFAWLPYEGDFMGERAATRHEIDYPFDFGSFKVVPFALGELAHWGEALDGQDNQRAYGQLGIRASMPMWSYDSNVESQLFNVHGLAHKIVFDLQLEHTEATRRVDELVLYDEIDDNNIQQFRRRFRYDTFGGGPVPWRFDERNYAVRSGLQNWVTGPTEIADNLTALRMGVNQRWQTKRGLPGQRKIVDWITLDTRGVLFDAGDNFGEGIGLLSYDFMWHIGDRTTLVSAGDADLFDEGQRAFSVGAHLTRPPRGNLYVGFRSLEGPISSNVISASYIYRMSPKWVSSFGTSYDFSDDNIGQHLEISRLGESFIVSLNTNLDAGRDNFGIGLSIEPRFLSRSRLSRGGFNVPSAGAYGLE